jgi:ubiquinone/menaquinone biosynthesis C-methylase UbiE
MALFQLLWNAARRELDTRPGSLILDICCGSGLSLLGVVSHPHLRQAVGVDLSLSLLDFLQRRYEPFGNVSSVCGDALHPMFRPASFHLILASSAYHHIEHANKSQFLSACHSLLKPEGRLLMAENCLPPYEPGDAAYDEAVLSLYAAVKRSSLHEFPHLPSAIADMIDENVRLSLARCYEFKVHYVRVLQDIAEAGFLIERELQAWPSQSGILPKNSGNILLILKKK